MRLILFIGVYVIKCHVTAHVTGWMGAFKGPLFEGPLFDNLVSRVGYFRDALNRSITVV